MSMKHSEAYRNPETFRKILGQIKRRARTPVRLMEVCGTHTMSIFRHGIRAILPEPVSLLSGPGCPVCVTTQNEIDAFIELSKADDVITTTFGDVLRVPGTDSSLQKERAKGRDIRVVYSTHDALTIARKNPQKKVVFFGIGFETTAPTVAASLINAKVMRIDNFFIFSAHKLIPPALTALMEAGDAEIDGFILPGHVSVVIGAKAYVPFFERFRIPCVIAGFEPVDILGAIDNLLHQLESGDARLENGYLRAVTFEGNEKARIIMKTVFEPFDAAWRGMGTIPKSGLKIGRAFASFDAQRSFDIGIPNTEEKKGCACGEVLRGIKTPPECRLYKRSCTPMHPVGPCMVSSEGACAAFYRYSTKG